MSNTSLDPVDLNLLAHLDLLLQERSVRGAARRAHLTPSAMSHALQRLRGQFGDELLVRAGRQMLPTARAEALAPAVQEVLARARGLLEAEGPVDPFTLRRTFRLVCTDHVSTVLLPAVEARLAREAPGVDLVVCPLVPETMEDLRQGMVDAAIGVFPDAPPELRVRRLFDDAFVTVSRRGHPRVGRRPLTLEDYLAEDHVLVAPRGDPRGLVDEVLASQGLRRRVARAYPVFFSALWHTAQSDALLTVSRRLVQATAARLDLVAMSPPLPLPPYTLVLTWHPRVDQARDEAWLRQVLVDAATALPAPGSDTPGA